MKNLICAAACTVFLSATGMSQRPADETWGCPARDYKCQLDVRMKALQADPKNPENYYNIGIVFQRSGNHAQAVESFSMYITIPGVKPELLADGYNMRGISQRALRKPDLAVADYTKAAELNPKNPAFLVNRGNANLDLKKPDGALADYARAISIDPNFALAYANRGNFFAGTNRHDDAIKDLTKAIELDAANPEPYYTRAMAYRAKQEFGKAIPDLDRYITLLAGNSRYLADGHLNRGIAYAMTGNSDKALKDFSKAIELAPDYADAYGARALLYRQLKKIDLAEVDERKFAELNGRPK